MASLLARSKSLASLVFQLREIQVTSYFCQNFAPSVHI